MQTQLFFSSPLSVGENRFAFLEEKAEETISGIISVAVEKFSSTTEIRGRIEDILSVEGLSDDQKVEGIIQLLAETFDAEIKKTDITKIAELKRAIRFRLASAGKIKFQPGEDIGEHTYGL